MNTINSLTITLTQTQTTASVGGATRTHNHSEHQESRVSDSDKGHHQHRGGALMQNVIQALQSFGLNFPGRNTDTAATEGTDQSTSPPSSLNESLSNVFEALHTFLHDLHQALKQSGTQQQAVATDSVNSQNTPATTSTSATPTASTTTSVPVTSTPATPAATTTSSTPSTPPASTNVRQTLHAFVKDLRQVLTQSDESHARFSGRHNGYSNFTVNLRNLITALSNDSGENSEYSKLKSDFTNLINVLGSSDSAQPPTLLDFLNKLAGNSSDTSSQQTSTGSILIAEA